MLKTDIMTLADAANVSVTGNINILGAFTFISAEVTPAVHHSMVLVCRFTAADHLRDQLIPVTVEITDPDRNVIGRLELGETKIRSGPQGSSPVLTIILNLWDVPLPTFGYYKVSVISDGVDYHSFTLPVLPTIPEGEPLA